MSRHSHKHDTTHLLAAAQHWKKNCLLRAGSLFSDKNLWTLSNLDELDKAFVQNPLEGNESYLEKLKLQLSDVSPQAARLMAELHWVLLLFPHNINPSTKRGLIQELWALGNSPLDGAHPMLNDAILAGAAHSGTAYNTHRWRELTFLIHIVAALKKLPRKQCQQKLAEPWTFSEWLASVPREGYRQFRHMMRWLLFPDTFERICTSLDKWAILAHFDGIALKQLKKMPDVEIDRQMLELRQRLENESGESVDFYDSPWVEQWRPSPGTWLMAWNPKHWPWKSYQDDRLKIASGENVSLPWRTASTQPREGDTFYLVRVGQEPRGLIARGNIASAPFEDDHYNAERAANGETARFVDITLTDLRDPDVDDYISMDTLQSGTTDDQN